MKLYTNCENKIVIHVQFRYGAIYRGSHLCLQEIIKWSLIILWID